MKAEPGTSRGTPPRLEFDERAEAKERLSCRPQIWPFTDARLMNSSCSALLVFFLSKNGQNSKRSGDETKESSVGNKRRDRRVMSRL